MDLFYVMAKNVVGNMLGAFAYNLVGNLLKLGEGVLHRKTETCRLYHRHIVYRVADGNRLLGRVTEKPREINESRALSRIALKYFKIVSGA